MNAWLRIDFECAAWQLAELSACLEALGAKAVSCVAAENQPDLFVEDVNQEVCWPQSVVRQALFNPYILFCLITKARLPTKLFPIKTGC